MEGDLWEFLWKIQLGVDLEPDLSAMLSGENAGVFLYVDGWKKATSPMQTLHKGICSEQKKHRFLIA